MLTNAQCLLFHFKRVSLSLKARLNLKARLRANQTDHFMSKINLDSLNIGLVFTAQALLQSMLISIMMTRTTTVSFSQELVCKN